jgi:hypothetical protein
VSIVRAIKYVDEVFLSIDKDLSVCDTLDALNTEAHTRYAGPDTQVIFAKGGDRMASEIPEAILCKDLGIQIVDGLGSKTHHSSDMIKSLRPTSTH